MVDKPSTPAIGHHVAMKYSNGEVQVGEIKAVNLQQGIAMVLWPENPIEDWIQIANLGWDGKRWTATVES